MKNKIILFAATALILSACTRQPQEKAVPTGGEDRAFWVETMTKIADPVLSNLAAGTLKKNMPYESLMDKNRAVSYLEAFGRTMAGVAPWLELGPDDTEEGKLRAKYIDMAVKAYKNATNPASPDYLLFASMIEAALLEYTGEYDSARLHEGLDRFLDEWYSGDSWYGDGPEFRMECNPVCLSFGYPAIQS
jgi:hypothetical protein